jgi:hypothetical protein
MIGQTGGQASSGARLDVSEPPSRGSTRSDPRGARGVNQSAILPSKNKQNQAEPSKNPWICLVLFVRIGAFQWVAADPNKNNSLASQVVCETSRTRPPIHLLGPHSRQTRRAMQRGCNSPHRSKSNPRRTYPATSFSPRQAPDRRGLDLSNRKMCITSFWFWQEKMLGIVIHTTVRNHLTRGWGYSPKSRTKKGGRGRMR